MSQLDLKKSGEGRRRLLGAAAVGVVALLTLAQSGQALAGDGEAVSQRTGEAEATRLLGLLELPPGSSFSATQPVGTSPHLSQPAVVLLSPAFVDTPSWWLAPGVPDSALAWLKEHPPAGSRLSMEASDIERGEVKSQSVSFGLPPVPGVFESRSLLVTAVSEPGGTTGLRADAQVVWTVPRPGAERVPLRARVLEVRYSGGGARPGGFVVSDPRQVRRIVALVNRLPIVQPSGPTYGSCPLETASPRTATLTFRRARAGRALAVASQTQPPGDCAAMDLTINGKRQTPLVGGAAVLRALRPLRAG
jgi:hypothetical protein